MGKISTGIRLAARTAHSAIAIRAIDQIKDAATGCCIGQALIVADGFGLWNSWRVAAATALTGFQSAMARSQGGIPEVLAPIEWALGVLEPTGLPARERLETIAMFNWFVGDNELHAPIYDATSGGCRDGLHADRVNENEGAESTLSFLLALTEMRAADRAEAVNRLGRDQ